jgi:hypothetical protein
MSAGRKRLSRVAAKRTTTTTFDFPHIIEAQECLNHPVRHSVPDNNVRSRVLQVHKLSRWLFSEALPPVAGNRVVSDHNPPAATRALSRCKFSVQIHNGKRGRSVGIKPIDRSGHRVKSAHAPTYMP